MLIEKLGRAEDRFREIEQMLTLPEIVSNSREYTKLTKEYNSLLAIVEKFREYKQTEADIAEADAMMRDGTLDAELREFAESEFYEKRDALERILQELKILLMPRDPNDDRNVMIEIRQGAGGEEAALFGAELYRMYSMYSADMGYRTEVIRRNDTELGGLKEIVFKVSGDGAYSKFKFESGVHRVQRIPVTESNGKIQTSTVTVAVLPEADKVDVDVNVSDIKFESCKSSGAGGQHINKTESAVRLTHIPTGIVIECDNERSQLQNKERALSLLYSKLYDIKQREQSERIAKERKSQVGSGDRSEKIRTYNFPQSRVTDHRINKTIHSLDAFLNGSIGDMIAELISADTARRLRGDDVDN